MKKLIKHLNKIINLGHVVLFQLLLRKWLWPKSSNSLPLTPNQINQVMILRLSDWSNAQHHDEMILIGPRVAVVVEEPPHNHVTRRNATFLRRRLRQQDQEQRLKCKIKKNENCLSTTNRHQKLSPTSLTRIGSSLTYLKKSKVSFLMKIHSTHFL